MAIEVEQKFRCDHLDAVRAALGRHGAVGGETVEQVDRYYRHPVRDFAETDEAFRLRTVGDKNCLTYKGPKLDAHTKTRREEEVVIADGPAAAATCDRILQQLGFSEAAEVRKGRQIWRLVVDGQPVEVALDQVERVGAFVELEIHVEGASHEVATVDAAKAALARLAGELGLGGSERRSYLELLLGD